MEPLSAFGLAAGILQIIDFSTRLLSTGQQLYQDGSTVQNSEFTLIADDLSSMNDKIKSWARPDQSVSGPLAKENQALETLADEIAKIVGELNRVLLRVRRKGEATIFKSFKQAVSTMWNKSKIDEIMQRLEYIRGEVQFRILVSMVEKVDKNELSMATTLQSFDHSTQIIVQAILQGKSDLADIISAQTHESIRREHARELAAIRRHEEVIAKIGGGLSHGTSIVPVDDERFSKEAIHRRITTRLEFPKKMDRYDIIKPAHKRTFDWIFQETQADAQWSNFSQWLLSKTGVFWISGKAGSGKSTLMKYLMQDRRLRQALELWAGNVPLIITSFYFWNPGDAIQKSQEGLFRTLIAEALYQEPELGPILFPDLYQTDSNWESFPTFHQLRRAFLNLTTQSVTPLEIALVIDGLDEFQPTDASYTELADLFLTTSESSNIKAILSSRPLSAFEAAFSDCPKLRLQDLTKHDIEIYIADRLGSHPRVVELSQDDPIGIGMLRSEILSAASGVFLWVKLAVDSLLEGLQNFDLLEDLRARLKAIPRDLEQLFQRMLNQIPMEYKQQSSQMFQIARYNEISDITATDTRPGICPLTALGMYFTEYSLQKTLEAPITPTSDLENQKRSKEIEGRLRSRCAGLLEMRPSDISNSDPEANGSTTDRTIKEGIEKELHYLHRTVADWLRKDHIWESLVNNTQGTNFDPCLSIMLSVVLRLKCLSPARRIWQMSAERKLVNGVIFYARTSQTTSKAYYKILDELDRVMSVRYRFTWEEFGMFKSQFNPHVTWCDSMDTDPRPTPWHDTFLAFTIRHGLFHYVKAKLEENGNVLPQKRGRPLLDYACRSFKLNVGHVPRTDAVNASIVEILLKHGADPNEKFDGFSPWQNALYRPRGLFPNQINEAYSERVEWVSNLGFSSNQTDEPNRQRLEWVSILKLLLKYGSDPHSYTETMERFHQPGEGGLRSNTSIAVYCHRRSVLTVLREEAGERDNFEEMRDMIQVLIKDLEMMGAKEEDYWVGTPGSDNGLSHKPESKNLVERTVEKAVSKEEKIPRHRARRYLERLFKSSSEARKK
ncbi:unnamed protein product [Periconia digitata]|uniref:NACHT domain-containing protein n=1 Tax=Periconia digitata TaxID=1303443 RepID=A0A9W4UQ32_9PLEO|nr:unnamed protein product [Periconia digitata]